MTSLVEQFAQSVGWTLARHNIVVEGTSDVAFFARSSELHATAHGRHALDGNLAILAAGKKDDGGVDGVNRRLNLVRQLADVDRDAEGRIRHHFVGLLDNDTAGRNALVIASRFDRRVLPYEDLFLLKPVMPMFAIGMDRSMEVTRANMAYSQLDWEVEDLCSERILAQFERENPRAVVSRIERGGMVHRELEPSAKPELRRLYTETATIADAKGFLRLLKTMRIYLSLEHQFIVC